MKKIFIVSAFGRGLWLASDLMRRGFEVSLCDVSEVLGRWAPEDMEGPFGYFSSERILPTQMERLVCDDPSEATNNGFTVWLKSGPVEFKGPLTKHRLEKLGVNSEVIRYLSEFDVMSLESSQSLKAEIQKLPFLERWPASLAHQFSSSAYLSAPSALEQGRPDPLFNSYNLRTPTRPGIEKALAWCESVGVKVLSRSRVLDMAIEKKQITGLEIQGAQTGFIKADQFVWTLSSTETKFQNQEMSRKLFLSIGLEPEWCWVKFRVRLQKCRETEALPLCFLMIEDLEFAWTHSNFIFIRRTGVSEDFDFWLRIPASQRFQKQYLMDRCNEALELFNRRAERLGALLVDPPQEHIYTFEDLGPARSPVYNKESLTHFIKSAKANIFTNLHLDGPEQWDHLGWEGMFQHQRSISHSIQEWNDKIVAAEKRKEARK
jgi:hypothetical protein